MTKHTSIDTTLSSILSGYQESFSKKVHEKDSSKTDLLMDVFGITPAMKAENSQYWGRELGMCWQRLVVSLCSAHAKDFGPALKWDSNEPCDLTVGKLAIDTKYRIGSGDSGTLKKWVSYGEYLTAQGYTPTLLIFRTDNLDSAIKACIRGGWQIHTGEATLKQIHKLTNVELGEYLKRNNGKHSIGSSC